jgi:hypothetical protein
MRKFQMIGGAAGAIVMSLFVATGANAAQDSECKGLEQQRCVSETTCSWVRSYKTSKGTEVNAFCRRKPVRKQTTQAAPAQPDGT